jgi:hypothetical protein
MTLNSCQIIGFINKMIQLFIGKNSHPCLFIDFLGNNNFSLWEMNFSLYILKMQQIPLMSLNVDLRNFQKMFIVERTQNFLKYIINLII